jgi:hypothetical protein
MKKNINKVAIKKSTRREKVIKKTYNFPESTVKKIELLTIKISTKEKRIVPMYEVIMMLVDAAISDEEIK